MSAKIPHEVARDVRAPAKTGARLAALVFVAAALLLAACGQEAREASEKGGAGAPRGGGGDAARPAAAPSRPNVVLVLADDLDKAVFEGSTLDSAWEPEGMTFANALATTSLCCPSRASVLRGQYAHNTGLVNNDNGEPGGGAGFFRESGLDRRTLATILQGDGYETWFGGKYLNGYEEAGGWEGYVPPGWDHWLAHLNPLIFSRDGGAEDVDGHYTDRLAEEASRFIGGRPSSAGPFFMHVSTLDTHEPLEVPPRHEDAYPDARAPRPPSFDEGDLSDKPPWVRDEPPIGGGKAARIDGRHAARLRSALSLEDLCEWIVGALGRSGELDETYLILTSDNGHHAGLHRVRGSKWTPYTEAHEVPFVVRGPGVPEGNSSGRLVANTDVAPTVLDLAGAGVPGWMDGRSLVPLLGDAEPPAWRDSLLIEGAESGGAPERPAYSGVRREGEVYVEYADGEREYYDLSEDPHQLESRPEDAPPSVVEDLRALRDCAGGGCREAEGR